MNSRNTNKKILENQKLINLALFLVLILSLITLVSLFASRGIRQYEEPKKIIVTHDAFEHAKLIARGAIVYDIKTKKILYQKNSDEQFPLASVTKILTAVTALDLLKYTKVITINKEFLASEGDTGLLSGETWKLKDLLDFSLVASSNDGMTAVAAAAGAVANTSADMNLDHASFIKKMNAKATDIGMERGEFYNETGLDLPNGKNGGYASAKDIATLFEYTLRTHPEVFEATKENKISIKSENSIVHTVTNTNTSVDRIPNLVGSKTGYTDIAGGNLGIVFDAGVEHPIAVIVLGSTYDGRFTDIESLVSMTLKEINFEE